METITSASESAVESHSEGELTLDQIRHQSDVWIAPWRDPLLHLIALNAAGEDSKLPWNQQHKIQRIAHFLERRAGRVTPKPVENSSSSTEDLSWVESMVPKVSPPKSPQSLSSASEKSPGEVTLLTSLQQKQLRRTILAKSSERMRQRNSSLSSSDDEKTVKEDNNLRTDLLSVVKSLSVEDEGDRETEVSSTETSSKSDIPPSLQSNVSSEADPGIYSDQPEGPI